nr:phage protein Gp27 family protein [Paenibacillus melissococcoides]
MLLDTRYTYWEISEYLEEQGFEVSKSSIGRYALRVGTRRSGLWRRKNRQRR